MYDIAIRMQAAILDQVSYLEDINEKYKMYYIGFSRQQSIFIPLFCVALLVLFLAKLSDSFLIGKDNVGKIRLKVPTRLLRKNHKTERLRNSSCSDNDKTSEKRNSNDEDSDDENDDNSRSSNNSTGSAFLSLRRAPELVRQNLAQMINKFSWDDLSFWSPLYMLLPEDDMEQDPIADMDINEVFYYDDVVVEPAASLDMDLQTKPTTSISRTRHSTLRKDTTTITHFCFLVHGHRGMSRDLSYMQSVMRKQAKIQQGKYLRSVLRTHQKHGKIDSHTTEVHQHGKIELDKSVLKSSSGMLQSSRQDSEVSENSQHSITDQSLDSASDCDSDGQSDSHDNLVRISKPASDINFGESNIVPELVVYSPQCNEKKTDDGVVAGGERLVEEILTYIRGYMLKSHSMSNSVSPDKLIDITISLVGNSFGGLYARYAVAKLAETLQSKVTSQVDMILDDRYRVHLNVFCTTATPHLGLAGHTYVPLPRSAEFGVAAALGESGRDLFRLNPLLLDMATENYYIKPLGHFRKRLAYANAYGTDFPVPTRTAAFLSEASTYPHHFDSRRSLDTQNESTMDSDLNEETDTNSLSTSEFVVARLHTRKDTSQVRPTNDCDGPEHINDLNESEPTKIENLDESVIELAAMSASLDSLGWTKVFVDVRKQIPRIAISKAFIPNSLKTSLSSGEISAVALKSKTIDGRNFLASPFTLYKNSSTPATSSLTMEDLKANSPNTSGKACIHQLKEKGVAPSKDVAAAVAATTPLVSTDRGEISLQWPLGHNMMVAFSRSKWSAYMNKAGRPVVDSLAKELVKEIFAFSTVDR
jgi:Putative serine esterase (DUF676)